MEHEVTVADIVQLLVWLLGYVGFCALSIMYNRLIDKIPVICKIGIY